MKKIVSIAAVAVLPLSFVQAEAPKSEHKAGISHTKHWNYKQNGPAHWGEFSKTCAIGHAQSPINIVPSKTIKLDKDHRLSINENILTTAKVIDNGHSIKVTPKEGGSISVNGEKFKLLQFHFHGSSEHTVDGKQYDMVAHLVHQNPETKQLAVLAVFFEEGEKSAIFDTILTGIDKEVQLNPKNLLPADKNNYYHYVGSLTTPPCSENVEWYLLKEPAQASKEQIEAFRKYYLKNYRPTQKLNDRKIEAN